MAEKGATRAREQLESRSVELKDSPRGESAGGFGRRGVEPMES